MDSLQQQTLEGDQVGKFPSHSHFRNSISPNYYGSSRPYVRKLVRMLQKYY